MIIKGFQKLTLLDYPGQVASTIFVAGCNFACGYCYNQDLVCNSCSLPVIPEDEIFKELERRRKMIDGIVICGGEPTIYPGLIDFIKKCKERKLLVKLDTNGSNPEYVKRLIDEKLIDYVAMDLKAPFDEYHKVIGLEFSMDKIRESINLIINSGLDYEFRTTLVPGFHNNERVKLMAASLSGAKKYFLQLFKPEDKIRDPKINKNRAFTKEELDEFVSISREFVNCDLRI